MRASFFEKFLSKVERLGHEDVLAYLQRIAKEKGFLETIFNTLQEGIVVLDNTGKIEYLNRSAERLLSIPEDRSAPISRFIKEIDWATLLREGRAVTRMIEISYPERRVLEFYLVPVEQGSEPHQSFAAIFHDVTQSHAATQQALESEGLQAITLLAAGVAHEIGNPLNSLNIHLQLMERDLRKAPPELANRLKESITVARNEIDRLDSIINQFLRAIRPSRPDLKMCRMDVVLDQTLELLRGELDNRDVLLEKEIAEGLPEVSIDSEQIKQAFYNLVRNAIQAMDNAGILKIHMWQDNDWLTTSFIDNGSGIAVEDIPHIMQPFFTTKQDGNGLGLMIVQRIVREHGGELELESEKGRGTTVRIKIPIHNKRIHLLHAGSPSPEQ